MKNLNQVTFTGSLGADPKIETSESGIKIAYLNIAISNTYSKVENGETKKIDTVQWIHARAFDKLAEIIENYFKKGNRVLITGALNSHTKEVEGKKETNVFIKILDIINFSFNDNETTTQNE